MIRSLPLVLHPSLTPVFPYVVVEVAPEQLSSLQSNLGPGHAVVENVGEFTTPNTEGLTNRGGQADAHPVDYELNDCLAHIPI